MKRHPGSEFREWLVKKVSNTVFAFYKDESDESLAARIGVTMDVYRDAQKLFEERKREEGMPEGQRMGYRQRVVWSVRHDVFLDPPDEIYEEWVAIRDARRTTDQILLRSVIHAILKSTTQPAWLERQRRLAWISKSGMWIGQHNLRAHKTRLTTKLNDAAREALEIRARNTNVRPLSICRWAMNLFVLKKLPTPFIVQVPSGMYKTVEEYCTNPRITDP